MLLVPFVAQVRAAVFHGIWCAMPQCRVSALNVYLALGVN